MRIPLAGDRWQTTFDAMLDPVALMDTDGTILQCNRAFAAFLDQDAQAVAGHKCYHLIHHTEDHIAGCPLVRARASKTRETMELEVGAQTFLVVIDPIKAADGAVIGFVHVMRDITDRKRAEAQLNAQVEELHRWHAATLGREMRILDLKREVNALLLRAGQPSRYASAEETTHGE